jgi:7-keto-8-aminopelargonate synthetase-like enzyme
MDGTFSITIRGRRSADPEPVVSFVEANRNEPQPRLLVERLLYARALLRANQVLAPRFALGDCAAAHHIQLDGAAAALAATDRLMTYGFRVAPSNAPPGIRFSLRSSHTEAEIHALLDAITSVVRELSQLGDYRQAATGAWRKTLFARRSAG